MSDSSKFFQFSTKGLSVLQSYMLTSVPLPSLSQTSHKAVPDTRKLVRRYRDRDSVVYLRHILSIFTLMKKCLLSPRYPKIVSSTQIQTQKLSSIQVRPTLYLDTSQP